MTTFHYRRTSQTVRDRVAETFLGPEHFVQGIFIVEGVGILRPCPALRGSAQVSTDRIAEALQPWVAAGITTFLLFGSPDSALRDARGSAASDPEGPIPQALREIRRAWSQDLTLITDVCLCAYTDHGHCGILATEGPGGDVLLDNKATLPRLAAMACAHAAAGTDWVAPSAMADGQVGAIRAALDAAGYHQTKILGYSAKFASAMYGPFRSAADSAPGRGDRRSYQMDIRNGNEALEEVAADLDEGADGVMVKPAAGFLDVVARTRLAWPDTLLAAYHTSGELMALWHAARAGALDWHRALDEQLHGIRRAGADWILGYGAADWLGIKLPWEDRP